MTVYQCHCGKWHDSATDLPCALEIGTISGVYPLDRIDRFMIDRALRARHPTPSDRIRRILDLLAPTLEEKAADLAYVKSQAEKCRGVAKTGV